MNKAEILRSLEESRETFLDAIDELSPEEYETSGVVGEWSLKDVLAHLTRWEAELVKLLWQAYNGQRPTTLHFSDLEVDKINARWQVESRPRQLEKVLEDFHAVRNQTARRVEEFSDHDLTDPKRYPWLGNKALWQWISNDSFGHEQEHLDQLLAWKAK